MNRAELEHLIRAAGTIANDDLVIVGSQAVLGAVPDALLPDSDRERVRAALEGVVARAGL